MHFEGHGVLVVTIAPQVAKKVGAMSRWTKLQEAFEKDARGQRQRDESWSLDILRNAHHTRAAHVSARPHRGAARCERRSEGAGTRNRVIQENAGLRPGSTTRGAERRTSCPRRSVGGRKGGRWNASL